ncbi:hypothetical protein BJ878DRAFT_77295 [Calycina marina]|uniref:HIT-type domain-containing protein n=1 Tax=Calycina marina TaxID=1763456 RepID=A0A9P7Z9Y3_9HELO|nr:hypothetical protein BJ878DRAFT_77295 [Calycina marina]
MASDKPAEAQAQNIPATTTIEEAGDTMAEDAKPDGIPSHPETQSKRPSPEPNGTTITEIQEVAAPVITEVSPEPEAIVPKTKVCGVCNESKAKYKCPQCNLPYCSVPCHKVHQPTHPPLEPTVRALIPAPKKAINGVARAGTRAGAVANPFSPLDDAYASFVNLFQQYPRLPQTLLEIERASQRPVTDAEARQQLDLLTQYTFEQGKGSAVKNRPWDQNRGNDGGVQALRNARRVYGKDGEGMRQYGELVLGVLHKASVDEDVVRGIERERRDIDARLVEELMQLES